VGARGFEPRTSLGSAQSQQAHEARPTLATVSSLRSLWSPEPGSMRGQHRLRYAGDRIDRIDRLGLALPVLSVPSILSCDPPHIGRVETPGRRPETRSGCHDPW